MTEVTTEFRRRDHVRIRGKDEYDAHIGYVYAFGRYVINGDDGVITRVGTEKMLVRFGDSDSHWVHVRFLEPVTINPDVRMLGQKPEGDEFIGQDHPGIQWLWDDMAQYAKDKSWCSDYDRLAGTMGIPGRKRKYSVSVPITVAGGGQAKVTLRVEARSREEAQQEARKLLTSVSVSDEEASAVEA